MWAQDCARAATAFVCWARAATVTPIVQRHISAHEINRLRFEDWHLAPILEAAGGTAPPPLWYLFGWNRPAELCGVAVRLYARFSIGLGAAFGAGSTRAGRFVLHFLSMQPVMISIIFNLMAIGMPPTLNHPKCCNTLVLVAQRSNSAGWKSRIVRKTIPRG